VADLKPVYLIHGDDDAKIDAWRSRVRTRAETEHGPGGLESFDPKAQEPEELAAALSTLSFAGGTRYLLADDAGGWKAAQLPPLEAALAAMPPDTVLVLIVRGKPLKALLKAAEKAGAEVREYAAPKPWELPKWVVGRGRELGLEIDPESARELVDAVGTRQQQLARELEKLVMAIHPERRLTPEHVRRNSGGGAGPQAYELADAVVAGDARTALALTEKLRLAQEPAGLIYPIVRRLRDVHRAATLLQAGTPEQKLGPAIGQPPWLAKRTAAAARNADREELESALIRFADLERDLRNGVGLDPGAALTLAVAGAAG
jgi:DNA polymerase III subunit delta